MESLLLCTEDWLQTTPPKSDHTSVNDDSYSFYTTPEDCHEALLVCLQKEHCFMPQPGYLDRFRDSGFLHARIKSVGYFIKCCSRMNLGLQTVFDAVNHFDRFISTVRCADERIEGWIELLSIACLSVSAKFVEVCIPQFDELQMDENLKYSFQPKTIQLMELEVLKVVEWRLNCVTSYSYKELLMKLVDYGLQPNLQAALSSRVTELLLGTLSDPKFIEFRPRTIAVSALKCSLEELLPSKYDSYISTILGLIPQDQKLEMENCHKIMEERVADPLYSLSAYGCAYFPSSPVTVMPIQKKDAINSYINHSMGSNVNLSTNPKKRNREEDTL